MLYNINRDRDKDPEGKGWADFYPTHKRELPAQSDEEMFVSMQMWAAMTQRAVPRS